MQWNIYFQLAHMETNLENEKGTGLTQRCVHVSVEQLSANELYKNKLISIKGCNR